MGRGVSSPIGFKLQVDQSSAHSRLLYYWTFFMSGHCTLDVDECGSNPCLNNGQCLDLQARYMCSCLPGFTGLRCQTGE